MRALIQRVKKAAVAVDGSEIADIETGYLVYLGIAQTDSTADSEYVAKKITHIRIWPDEDGKMNLSVQDLGLPILVVSQFTLYGNTSKGRRPSFNAACPPDRAEPLFTEFLEILQQCSGSKVVSGRFGAHMEVTATNDGPINFLVDSV